MTPEAFARDVDQIVREALCSWDALTILWGRDWQRALSARNAQVDATVFWAVVSREPLSDDGAHALRRIAQLEETHSQPRHAQRVVALLEQRARDEDGVSC